MFQKILITGKSVLVLYNHVASERKLINDLIRVCFGIVKHFHSITKNKQCIRPVRVAHNPKI